MPHWNKNILDEISTHNIYCISTQQIINPLCAIEKESKTKSERMQSKSHKAAKNKNCPISFMKLNVTKSPDSGLFNICKLK